MDEGGSGQDEEEEGSEEEEPTAELAFPDTMIQLQHLGGDK